MGYLCLNSISLWLNVTLKTILQDGQHQYTAAYFWIYRRAWYRKDALFEIADLWLHLQNGLILKTMEWIPEQTHDLATLNYWPAFRHIQPQTLQKVTLTFSASHQTLVKSLCSCLAEPRGHNRAPFTASQRERLRQNRGGRLKKNSWSPFPISLLSQKSPRCLRFLAQPSTTLVTQFWGWALFQCRHISQLARRSPNILPITHKEADTENKANYQICAIELK